MQVLKLNLKYLSVLGIGSLHDNIPTVEFLTSFKGWLLLLGNSLVLGFFTVLRLFENYDDLKATIAKIMVITAGLNSVCVTVSIGLNMNHVKTLFHELQSIVDSGECRERFFALSENVKFFVLFTCSSTDPNL